MEKELFLDSGAPRQSLETLQIGKWFPALSVGRGQRSEGLDKKKSSDLAETLGVLRYQHCLRKPASPLTLQPLTSRNQTTEVCFSLRSKQCVT